MKAPLDQFCDRIIRNNEVDEFIEGMVERGVSPEKIKKAAEKAAKNNDLDDGTGTLGRYRMWNPDRVD